MIGRFWKPLCGSYALELLGGIFLKNCVLGRPPIIGLTVGLIRVCGKNFF